MPIWSTKVIRVLGSITISLGDPIYGESNGFNVKKGQDFLYEYVNVCDVLENLLLANSPSQLVISKGLKN